MRAEVIEEIEELNSKSIEELEYYFNDLHTLLHSRPDGLLYKGLYYVYDVQSDKIICTGFNKQVKTNIPDSITCLGEQIKSGIFEKCYNLRHIRLPIL